MHSTSFARVVISNSSIGLPLRNPGKVVRRMQNVRGHILAEIQLFRREHGTTCSLNPNFLLTLTVSQETLSLCNTDRFIASQSLANDLRSRDHEEQARTISQGSAKETTSERCCYLQVCCRQSEVQHEKLPAHDSGHQSPFAAVVREPPSPVKWRPPLL